MILSFFVVAFFIFSYHFLRNGYPWKAYGTTVARVIWALSFTIGYALLALPSPDVITGGLFAALQFLAMLIPHAAFQNMGTWPTPQKSWTAFFLPTKTIAEWSAMSPFAKTRYDFWGMLSVGVTRAIIVFGVSTAVLVFTGGETLLAVPAAIVAAVSQPVAYLVGKYVPFSIWNTPAKSSAWGEIGVAVSWAISLIVYVGFFVWF